MGQPATRTLPVAACFDCHSNETHTQWWEDLAPGSWWITNHVQEGRAELNFSECTQGSSTSEGSGENEASEAVREGSMPPNYYTWLGLHADAKLTRAEHSAARRRPRRDAERMGLWRRRPRPWPQPRAGRWGDDD